MPCNKAGAYTNMHSCTPALLYNSPLVYEIVEKSTVQKWLKYSTKMVETQYISQYKLKPMRPKARGLAQYGGPPAGWRRVTRQV
jgi:hypothetical protein